MNITIERTKTNDIETLFKIRKAAFHSDFQKYQDIETSPFKEPIEEFEQKINQPFYFTIFSDQDIVGGLHIKKLPDNHYRIYEVYLDPSIQNKGRGSLIMGWLEETFSDAKMWSLNTPKDNDRNRHFYEKFNYELVSEHKINHRLTLIEYVKFL